jgi:nucleoid-associated protein YgaU
MGRYTEQTITTGSNASQMYTTTKYQKIPLSFEDIFVITTIGDRLDVLADQYYNDSTLWWVISMANDQLDQSSYYVEPGIQLRIPANLAGILSNFKVLNES